MAVLLITYDLNKETTRPPLLDDIQKFPEWARLSESSYAVDTNLEPDDVYDRLRKHLDENDSLYVITLRRPYSGQGTEEVNEWLADKLT